MDSHCSLPVRVARCVHRVRKANVDIFTPHLNGTFVDFPPECICSVIENEIFAMYSNGLLFAHVSHKKKGHVGLHRVAYELRT